MPNKPEGPHARHLATIRRSHAAVKKFSKVSERERERGKEKTTRNGCVYLSLSNERNNILTA